ncbi:pseudouridine synthase [Acidovorax sp. NCPPB 2350]|nr:pseudouridine synthase [Acidovorax sp. NCPPB 2350]
MRLQEILYSQGFGTRRVCAGLIQRGLVQLRDARNPAEPLPCTDTSQELDPDDLTIYVQGTEWRCHSRAYVMMHKPAGTECSQKPSAHPSIYTLLPDPLRARPGTGSMLGVQAIGRLDQDTTGLLLLSDDGHFIHRMSSPKKSVPKVYRVHAKHGITPQQIERLLEGVALNDDPAPVRAAACTLIDEQLMDLTLTEGKYHQVKRMVAAVGNRVEALHRVSIGGLVLPGDLAPGQWRWLSAEDLAKLSPA